MRYDLHIHTHYSKCSNLKPEVILKTAKAKGLNGIAVTDHNTIKGALEIESLNKNKEEYVFIITGGLGEKNAVLTHIVNDKLGLKVDPQDLIIFSNETIPTPTIQANRKILEYKLHRRKARLFKDIHVSGHASREELRDLIKIVSPDHILPAHGDLTKTSSMASLATEIGYDLSKNIHIMQNGHSLEL